MVIYDDKFLAGIFDSVTDPFAIYDRNFRILRANQALTTLFELSAEQIVGKHCYEVFYHRSAMCPECSVKQVFDVGEPQMREKHIPLPDGRKRVFEVYSYPIKDQNGIVMQAVEYIKDIAERKHLEKQLLASKDFNEKIINSITDNLIVLDPKTRRIIHANESFCARVGLKPSAITTKRCYEIMRNSPTPCEANGIACPVRETLQSKCSSLFDRVYPGADGEDRVLQIATYPIFDDQGETISIIRLERDVTEKRKMQDEILQQSQDLGERIKELNCLYGVSRLMEKSGRSSDKIFQDSANLIPLSWQYPDITCARITFEGKEFVTTNWAETRWKQSADIMVGTEKIGNVEVAYLEEKSDIDEGPFLNEERDLIEALARLLGNFTKRKRAEDALVFRSKELQRAQHQLEELFKISRKVSAKNSLSEIIDYVCEIVQEIFPNSVPLMFLLNAVNENFFRLEGCSTAVLEPLLKAYGEIERSELIPDFIRYLQNIREPHIIDSEHGHNIPNCLNTISKSYPKWFGFPIAMPQRCIGYFMLGSPSSQGHKREDMHFLLTLFNQIAGHIHHLVAYENEINHLRQRVSERTSHGKIIGQSDEMQKIYDLINLVAASDAIVLITGENGTGKELVAQAIHQKSHRKEGPFMVANCSAYSPALLESELFGHEKGAFTGAIKMKKGRIERAQGGILFLDEIGDIAPATQILLLRFLQDHCFERVGGEETMEADVRVLAATNRDLYQEMEAGRFRNDLYYRLNVVTLHLPPLRDRKEDIPLLCRHFLKKHSLKEGKKIQSFSPGAMQVLMDYEWPGNVRQLENAVSHAVILAQSRVVERRHLPQFLKQSASAPSSTSLAETERRLILGVLQETNWNKHEAAQRLEISRSTLYSKIRRFRLEKGII